MTRFRARAPVMTEPAVRTPGDAIASMPVDASARDDETGVRQPAPIEEWRQMFVQIIEGRVKDRAALRAQEEEWVRSLRPGAKGFLGSTALVTADDRLIMFARFESEAAARANSDRPEQGAWWEATLKCLDGPPEFTESSDVEELLGGGSNDARFVQVMKAPDIDRQRLAKIDEVFALRAGELRPDLFGGFRVWTADGACYSVDYFTSEADARAAEQQELPADVTGWMREFGEIMQHAEYLDATDIHLV
jgi:quinol monooxygenase YgiN